MVSTIEGQEFHNRIEKPTKFDCPECGQKIIFSPRTKILFHVGALLSFLASPSVYWVTSNHYAAMTLMVCGLLVLSTGLITQKLIVAESK
jgi:DNA-directed RNA polymerase subunit RPC12/RpoP